MNDVVSFVTGPLFSFSMAVFLLGILRLAAIVVIDVTRSMGTSGDRTLPWKNLLLETASWLVPITRVFTTRRLFSVVSFLFHLTLLAAIVLHQDHILIVKKTVGVSWPFLDRDIINFLTIMCILCALVLIFFRLFKKSGRALSDGMDYFILLLISAVLISGFVASKAINPLSYGTMLIVHALCGNAILMIIPFSRLGHFILYPILWIATATAWKFPPGVEKGTGNTEIGWPTGEHNEDER
mgnify:CR=1 FL=1